VHADVRRLRDSTQRADIVPPAGIVAFHSGADICSRPAKGLARQFPFDSGVGDAEAERETIAEAIAHGRLRGDELHVAGDAEIAALKGILVFGLKAVRRIYAE